jgi:hypothetical protein
LKPSTYFEIYKIFSLEELQFFLGVSHTDKNGKVETVASYLDYKNFRKRVLDPAINEVCKNTDVEVSYSVKTSVGRKITHLKFAFKHVAAASKYRGEVSEITRRLSFVEPITMAKTIVEKYSNITIATNLDYLNNIIERDFDVKNLSKFFLYLLKYDIASLPDIANPHSGLHKPQTADYDFIRMHIMPNWLLIPDSWKRDLQIYGLSASCVRDDFHMFKTQWDLGNIPKHVFVSVHQVDSPEWQEEFKSWASSETMLDW